MLNRNASTATATIAIPPCKDQLPAPPRSLNAIDKSKYQMEAFLHNGELIEEKKSQAYEQYYSIKFK